jgi:molybdate-binding protein/transcriptional regulator with XRE-family HTH domain
MILPSEDRMMPTTFSSHVTAWRQTRGWSQAELARASGVSRAAISAIETSRLVPSTAAALRLARALEVPVETLFELGPSAATPAWAWPSTRDTTRVWQASVGTRRLLYPVEPTAAGTLPHDAVVNAGAAGEEAIAATPGAGDPDRTLVLAGCDPTVGLLVQMVAARSGIRLLPLLRSSREALDLLKRGLVHAAGFHLRDEGASAARQATGHDRLVRQAVGAGAQIVHVATWDAGVAVNPAQHARSVAALLRGGARWVNREEGSGARECLDHLIDTKRRPIGYDHVVRDHRAVAATVSSGWADAGICLRPVAEDAGLDFLPIRQEAYEICVAPASADDPRIVALLDAVRSLAYRRLLGDVPGYETTETGALREVA